MAASANVTTPNRSKKQGTLNLGSYATGGVAVNAATFGHPTHLERVSIPPLNGLIFDYSPATGNVKAYNAYGVGNTMTEVSNATNLSAINAPFRSSGY